MLCAGALAHNRTEATERTAERNTRVFRMRMRTEAVPLTVAAPGQRLDRRLGFHCVGGSFKVRCRFSVRLWPARAASRLILPVTIVRQFRHNSQLPMYAVSYTSQFSRPPRDTSILLSCLATIDSQRINFCSSSSFFFPSPPVFAYYLIVSNRRLLAIPLLLETSNHGRPRWEWETAYVRVRLGGYSGQSRCQRCRRRRRSTRRNIESNDRSDWIQQKRPTALTAFSSAILA